MPDVRPSIDGIIGRSGVPSYEFIRIQKVVCRNELDRLKRYENHLAILNSHKERRSYPQTLSYMPKSPLGADDDNFLTVEELSTTAN
ncbi:unnamed protein product [Didymodactylos carnosus]|uniref:Uncharacterized protein n=1 Tax=Didymodactylos carnosus TaxID=1234261 RepID=A0A815NUJ5_9BILA|nr:unnamed protein product [Didymodactylos carnosus]CAF1442601.1 unnamed protein product [Didymodactylos carnosus]CAF4013375.1 unnamed protein product [Didymodactylos carnosus]CAF4318232.1 unnamed protein product [Didymodactylos carnosus]